MRISVLIIAHNEEDKIKDCLCSVINQTIKPDDIILVAHNCTDRTIKVAQEFKTIKIIRFDGP